MSAGLFGIFTRMSKTTKTPAKTASKTTSKAAPKASSKTSSKAAPEAAKKTTAKAASKTAKKTTSKAAPKTKFKDQQQVVYPLQGVGQIIKIEKRPFKGEKILYYIIYQIETHCTTISTFHR